MSESVSESLLSYGLKPIRKHVPEGSTIIFEAPQRWGKSLSMVMWGLSAFQSGRTIFSNIQLAYPHAPLEFTELKLEGGASRFWNGWVMIDELNFYFDGRRSISAKNIEFSAFLLQQKKQGCAITGTTHSLESLDVRLRQNHDFLIRTEVFPKHPKPPEIVTWDIESGPTQARFRKKLTLDCRPFLGLYDTFATYDPFKQEEPEEDIPRKQRRVNLSG